jgi:hypothetical protein
MSPLTIEPVGGRSSAHYATGLRATTECAGCLRSLAHGVLVQSARNLDLCPSCADRLAARRGEAMMPLVGAAFAQFLHDWSMTVPTDRGQGEAARRFWASLEPYGEALDHVEVKGALELILGRAPTAAREITD